MKKIMIVIMLLTGVLQSQEIRVAVWQDARLAITEDKTGNYQPFTLNVYGKLKLMGNQTDAGHLVISPTIEYAELEGTYRRFAFDVGFTFDQSLISGLEVTPSINYGIQDRWGKSHMVFGADLEVSYEILSGLHISVLGQLVDRKDLVWAYNETNRIGLSGFVGLQYKVFTPNSRK